MNYFQSLWAIIFGSLTLVRENMKNRRFSAAFRTLWRLRNVNRSFYLVRRLLQAVKLHDISSQATEANLSTSIGCFLFGLTATLFFFSLPLIGLITAYHVIAAIHSGGDLHNWLQIAVALFAGGIASAIQLLSPLQIGVELDIFGIVNQYAGLTNRELADSIFFASDVFSAVLCLFVTRQCWAFRKLIIHDSYAVRLPLMAFRCI